MNEKDTIKDNVLKAIQSGKVKVRPRWQFILSAVLAVVGGIIISLALLYFVSFAIFLLRENGVWFAPFFGFRGIGVFLGSLPWIVICLSIIFIMILLYLMRRYSIVYGMPFLYSALGIVFLVIVGGMVTASLHESFIPHERGMAPFFRDFHEPPKNITMGRIVQINNRQYILDAMRFGTITVELKPDAHMPEEVLKINDPVVVFGEREGNQVQAEDIKKLDRIPGRPGRFEKLQ